ncbi:hypothetical protein F4805DRAFT_409542 [Annulohypoxylon moriforme]|nr:hypothetical protein F4805DRAFT_409542 [Annulohypoxylon moriforme]
MTSLRNPNTTWDQDLSAWSKDDLEDQIANTQFILGFLEAEHERRVGRGQLYRDWEQKVKDTIERLQNQGIDEIGKERLTELEACRKQRDARDGDQKLRIRQRMGYLIWMIDELLSPEHTALAFIALGYRTIKRASFDQKSALIKFIYNIRDRLPSTLRGQTANLSRVPWSQTVLCSNHAASPKTVGLNEEALNVLKVLVFMGGKDIPWCLFHPCASEPSVTCGSDGQLSSSWYPNNLPSFITNRDKCQRCLEELEERQAICKSEEGQLFTVDDSLREHIEKDEPPASALRYLAFALVMHSFPKHRHVEVLYYTQRVKSMLPVFKHVLFTYLNDDPLIQSLSLSQVFQVIEACLSASYFYDQTWKMNLLEKIHAILSPFSYAIAKTKLRKLVLLRIEGTLPEGVENTLDALPNFLDAGKRSNALISEMLLFRAQLYQDRGDTFKACDALRSIKALDERSVSWLEKIQLDEKRLRLGQILRHRGEFAQSADCFENFLRERVKEGLLGKAGTHRAAVMCEIGHCNKAISCLNQELELLQDTGGTLHDRSAIRVKVALGEAYMMAGLTVPQCHPALSVSNSNSQPLALPPIHRKPSTSTIPPCFLGRDEHQLRRKTPTGTVSSGYDGSQLAFESPPLKHVILPTPSGLMTNYPVSHHLKPPADAFVPEEATKMFSIASATLDDVSTILSKVPLGRAGKTYCFRIVAAKAIMSHTQGAFTEAWAYWEQVRAASRNCGWKVGHSDMITSLSMCEIAYRFSDDQQADLLLEQALTIYEKTGQQYFFTGHGTVWPNLVLESLQSYFETSGGKQRCDLLSKFSWKKVGSEKDFPLVTDRLARTAE